MDSTSTTVYVTLFGNSNEENKAPITSRAICVSKEQLALTPSETYSQRALILKSQEIPSQLSTIVVKRIVESGVLLYTTKGMLVLDMDFYKWLHRCPGKNSSSTALRLEFLRAIMTKLSDLHPITIPLSWRLKIFGLPESTHQCYAITQLEKMLNRHGLSWDNLDAEKHHGQNTMPQNRVYSSRTLTTSNISRAPPTSPSSSTIWTSNTCQEPHKFTSLTSTMDDQSTSDTEQLTFQQE